MQSAAGPRTRPPRICGTVTVVSRDFYDVGVDAAQPGVPAVVGEGDPSTSSPHTPDGRLHQLLEELRAALERLDLTMTRRHLALLELHANRLAIDWLKTLRRANPGEGGHIVLSPVGQPKDVRPNVHFDFDKSSATLLGGFQNIGTADFRRELKFNYDFQLRFVPQLLSVIGW